jgi:hypothetical protein
MARETLDFIPSDVQSDTCEISKKKKKLAKLQITPSKFGQSSIQSSKI